jgi:hypothetical protein
MEHRLRLVQHTPNAQPAEKRAAMRHPIAVPGQLVWKDAKGTTRMASVVTRDVSETGVSVECLDGPAIPLYRIVYFQVDRSVRTRKDLPPALRGSNVLSAVFRIGEKSQRTGKPSEYGLRLLIEPAARQPVAATPQTLSA